MTRALRPWIFKDPVSASTHFVGFLLALGATAALVSLAGPERPRIAAMAIYGATLVTLFGASSLYHFFDLGERGNRWLRRLDHAAIFLLIAGTYVPPLLLLLDGAWRIGFLALVAGLALAGVLLKLFWIDCPGWLGLALYLGMGWLAVIPAHRIVPQLSGGALGWLIGGGAAYTLGAVVYARGWPDPWPGRVGHHEIWHGFVLAGAGAHFAFVCTLLDAPYLPL
jgi:hemolysin III